ncbi:MAG: rRNA maturation RNase YbeY [Candidatus Aminicenantes bacterium]|nr:rRNA maturation RNase YbeY [Candidatus Aminicenantes bacterium]NIM78640.1 rRNA maturation RNase YbeY [Candidatus Aminicenantes bacterium]NIN17887.1 rRNA maturation RNase YbeY [Candidatus Aminicenantes bacterium]NIN41790.1 rRNA maturation RNase YbeY [Candidatus Aminicenantes bacterium]NIN84542.1 rRNA maturation RNase YbeY [Candidatus Aminicenantes bacterium]
MIEMMSDDYHLDHAFYIDILQKITNELNINGNIVIKVGDKDESQQLNRDFLQRDYPTDVLSFTFNEELPDGFYLGDIFVCYPIAEEQAKENHISLEEELLILMIHGLLHLAGYDHEAENDSGEMLTLQKRLVKKVLP